jgi:hypothetical protein
MADRFPQERNRRQAVVLADQVPTPGLVGPWSPMPTTVEEALNQLVVATAPVVLAVLGPDVTGGGFGAASWAPGNWIGTNSVASFAALASPDLVGGYVAQTNEVIEQITVSAATGPSAASTLWIWVRPAGGVFADVLHAIPIGLGAKETYHTTPLALSQGDAVAFYLDIADPIWSVFGGAITITGLRRPS